MKIPLWKKYLSYLFEITVEETTSKHNALLKISLRNGRFRLSTQNAVYSYEDRYDNFRLSFNKINWEKLRGDKVLVLGLGLASIVQMLEQNFKQSFQYTAIEIDELVSLLAEKYILSQIRSPIQLIHADAAAFVDTTDEKYDIICMDIFDDDVIPVKFQEFEFLESLRNLLMPHGVLLYNCLASTREDRRQSSTFFKNRFSQVYPDAKLLKVRGNYMLINHAEYLK